MALFMDGFDYYAYSATELQTVWDGASTVSSMGAPGVFAYGKWAGTNTSTGLIHTLGGNWATVYFGFHCYHDASSEENWVILYDGTTIQCVLRVSAAGEIKLFRGDGATLLATSSPGFTLSHWHWFGIKIVVHNTLGSIDISLNGNSILSASGLDTAATANDYATKILLRAAGGSTLWDNVHIFDGTDPAPFNAQLPERRIYYFTPSGDGVDVAWTPSAGSRYTCVDEVPANDTDYISSSTATQKNGFIIPDLAAGVTPHAVKLSAYARKDDAGSRKIKLWNLYSAAYDYGDGTPEFTMLDGNAYYSTQWVIDIPTNLVTLTKTVVDASEWGAQLTV